MPKDEAVSAAIYGGAATTCAHAVLSDMRVVSCHEFVNATFTAKIFVSLYCLCVRACVRACVHA